MGYIMQQRRCGLFRVVTTDDFVHSLSSSLLCSILVVKRSYTPERRKKHVLSSSVDNDLVVQREREVAVGSGQLPHIVR